MRAILTFHAIDDGPGPLSFPARSLARLIASLRAARIPIVDLDTLLADDSSTGVCLTFDDGMASVAEAALPILRDHAIPAHVFLTTGVVGGDNRWAGQPPTAARRMMLDWRQVELLHEGGVKIEGHTAHHPDLRTLDDEAIKSEFALADDEIARRLSRRPRYFAYPYGFHDARVRAVAGRYYIGCVTTELSVLTAPVARDKLPRLDSHYLRSPLLMRHLASPVAHRYLALRRQIRRLRGRS